MIRFHYRVYGVVQGVGFRPYIYQLAHKFNLCGFVYNDSQGVTIELQGKVQDIELFDETFLEELPPLAQIESFEKHPIPLQDEESFLIVESKNEPTQNKTTLISSDIAVCKDCLEDLKSKPKYHNYFATNCTNCGPRYSIIETVPYDRKNTSMKDFTMCESCNEEYHNPLQRRYHAQPISCNNCGPKLSLWDNNVKCLIVNDELLKTTAQLIKDGKIGAIKGIGGFHLVCDATNDQTIMRLRNYKNRPTKPFALMCKDIDQIKTFAFCTQKEKEILSSPQAPIVILDIQKSTPLSKKIAPNIDKIGCMLPYTPLHIMLFEYLTDPIVATSANLGDEPIIIDSKTLISKLPFVEFILDNDREIINAIDDSLVQVVDEKIQVLRLARGYAPKVISLNKKINTKVLSVGANQKSTISLAFEDKLILSPHIGDLDSLKSFDYFLRTIETFKKFYDFEADTIISDLHPTYQSTKWAQSTNKSLFQIQHHLAHIYSVLAEQRLDNKNYVGFSFDGTGFGDDGKLWGGEVFVNDKRKYHFKPLKLLGGEKAIKEPRRVALSLLLDKYTLDEIFQFDLESIKSFSKNELELLSQTYYKNLNAPLSSSVGRLFDAVASFAGLCQKQSYEGEAGLLCESVYDETCDRSFEYTIIDGIIDIQFDFFDKEIVTKFINTLVQIIIDIAIIENKKVIVSGGVFQNKTLLSKTISKLKANNLEFYYNQTTPSNDGGISLGQLYFYLTHY